MKTELTALRYAWKVYRTVNNNDGIYEIYSQTAYDKAEKFLKKTYDKYGTADPTIIKDLIK